MDYFIADTHFGDSNIIAYENRPFADCAEMEEELIKRWNNVVAPEDTVYLLGDFSALNMEENKKILTKLNGRKILIMGNHDDRFTPDQWREQGFAECSEWPILYAGFYLLSHEPLYVNTNMPYANVFGHVHNNPIYRDSSPQSICVSAERIDYTPISADEMKKRILEAK